MTKYYAMKEASPELFKVSPPSQMQNMLEMQIQCMLPLRDSNGRQLYIFRVGKCDASNFFVADSRKINLFIFIYQKNAIHINAPLSRFSVVMF